MRVLMTTDTVGGVWTYSLQLAAALQPQGVQVHLATMGARITPAQRAAVNALPNVTLHPSTYKLEWMPDPWEEVDRAGEWLLQLEEHLLPDVIHLNGYVHAALPFQAPALVVGHSCVLSWWRAVLNEEAPPAWNTYRRRVRDGLHAADLVITPTHAMLHALLHHYGPLPRTQVIPNSRAADRFLPGAKQPLVFSAGRLWDQAKNLQTLDRAAARLSCPVLVAGDACAPGSSSQPTAAPNVTLLGRLNEQDIARHLAAAAIYALPARYEPFGLSILEAALAGCALVIGDIPSLREIWNDAAVFVPPNDAHALAAAIEDLLANPAPRELLARKARLRAGRYTPERMGSSYVQGYRSLVSPLDKAAPHGSATEPLHAK